MRTVKSLFCIAGLLGLVACGGSNNPPTFDEIRDDGLNMVDRAFALDISAPSQLPTSGRADYNGFVGVEVGGTDDIAGQMQINANFNQTIGLTGRVYNIVGEDNIAYNGELAIGNSIVDRNADIELDYTFAAEMDGTLTGGGSRIVVDAALLGDFYGPQRGYVAGMPIGTVTIDGRTQNITDGVFAAQR